MRDGSFQVTLYQIYKTVHQILPSYYVPLFFFIIGNFLRIAHRYAFESICLIALDTRMGCFQENMDPEVKEVMEGMEKSLDALGELIVTLPLWKISPLLSPR